MLKKRKERTFMDKEGPYLSHFIIIFSKFNNAIKMYGLDKQKQENQI
jgi:hypothetical protein